MLVINKCQFILTRKTMEMGKKKKKVEAKTENFTPSISSKT